MSQDTCLCGCGEPHRYPVGLTREEAELLLKELFARRHRGNAAAWSAAKKIEHALASAGAPKKGAK